MEACTTGAWVIHQFRDGPARLWDDDPPMLKLGQPVLDSVVYLFGSKEDAMGEPVDPHDVPEGSRSNDSPRAASGCLVEMHDRRGGVCQYVVTTRHEVRQGCVKARFSVKDPSGDHGYIIDAVEDDWLTELVETDLAVLPIGDDPVVKRIEGIRLSSFLQDWVALDVGADVAMPGRFFRSSGGSFNRPVTRLGSVATWPAASMYFDGKAECDDPQEAILVDMRSHGGYSGSPAFVFDGITERVREALMKIQHRMLTLASATVSDYTGVDVSEFNREIDIRDLEERQAWFIGIDHGHVQENMAAIIPWYRVREALESEVLVKQREKKTKWREPATVADFQGSGAKAVEDSFTRTDFVNALKKASKKSK